MQVDSCTYQIGRVHELEHKRERALDDAQQLHEVDVLQPTHQPHLLTEVGKHRRLVALT